MLITQLSRNYNNDIKDNILHKISNIVHFRANLNYPFIPHFQFKKFSRLISSFGHLHNVQSRRIQNCSSKLLRIVLLQPPVAHYQTHNNSLLTVAVDSTTIFNE